MILPASQPLSLTASFDNMTAGKGSAIQGRLPTGIPSSQGSLLPFATELEASALTVNPHGNQQVASAKRLDATDAGEPFESGSPASFSIGPAAENAEPDPQQDIAPASLTPLETPEIPAEQQTGKPLPVPTTRGQETAADVPTPREAKTGPGQAAPSPTAILPDPGTAPTSRAVAASGSNLVPSSSVDPMGPAPDDRASLTPRVNPLELAARRNFQRVRAQWEAAQAGNRGGDTEASQPAAAGLPEPAEPRIATELTRLPEKLGVSTRQGPASQAAANPLKARGQPEQTNIAAFEPQPFDAGSDPSGTGLNLGRTTALSSTLASEAASASPSVVSPTSLPEISATSTTLSPVAIATTPAPSSAVSPTATQPAPLATDIEQFVEQMADTREAARALRPELTVRHAEFGSVVMRLEAGASDWRATLSARDPGFAPAVQAALAERTVTAVSESGPGSNASSHKGSDTPSQSGSQSSQNTSNFSSGFGSSAGGNEARYGSSTGSSQGSAQPYLGEEGSDGGTNSATDQSDRGPRPGASSPDGAHFA
jgi:hypothetical protein